MRLSQTNLQRLKVGRPTYALLSHVLLPSLPAYLIFIPRPDTPWYSVPQVYGDYAGDKIKGTVGQVGQPVGEGLSHAVAPVGNVVGSVVQPVMILGDTMNDAPKWGPELEGSARDTAGKWLDQGKETLKKGQAAAETATREQKSE